ncbi:MAG: winged helix-turn-helix domain-containing protein [Thermoanaerobaculia bacterium]|nr:winged helix-turn-helix domain-containing protein [Thermoanaerobaculia bacterium]
MTGLPSGDLAAMQRATAGPSDLADALRRDGFRLGRWRIEPQRHRFVSDDEEKTVDPRLIDLIVYLASRSGQVVSKEDLLQSVWHGAFVTDNTVSQAISRLRKALGDDRRNPTYLETISKSGYRLMAEVGWLDSEAATPPDLRLTRAGPEPARSADDTPPSSPTRRWLLLGATVLGLALLASVTRFALQPRHVPLQISDVLPESTLIGNQFEPSLSPDGERLVFAWLGPDQSGFDIWIQQTGGDGPVRLTEDPAFERAPAWSADGQHVAFARFSQQEGSCGVFRMPAVGGEADRLGDCIEGMHSLHWSPDGRTLVTSGVDEEHEVPALFLLDVETGKARGLTNPPQGITGDRSPRFSPDGRWVAFTRVVSPSRHDVLIATVDGDVERQLTDDAWGQVRGVEWSRDGSSVLFSSNRDGRFALWRVSVDGGSPHPVPIHDAWVTQPSVARNTDRLIYRTFRDSVDLWEVPLDTEGQLDGEPGRRVASTRSERQPVWSPDGARLAFLSDRTGSLELWTGAPTGEELLRHTDLKGPLPGSPSWSPDGELLAYDASVHGHSDLWTVAADSRRPVRWTTEPSEERNPTFSRDGESIYFGSDRGGGMWEVWRMPTHGGSAQQVTNGGGFLAQESPDGSYLYYVKLDEPGIWRVPISGGEPEVVLRGRLGLSDWGNWLVDERGLWLVTRSPTTISYLELGTSDPRVVFTPPKQIPYLGRSISRSSDGRSLLFAMIDHSDDEIMRVEISGI